MKPRRVSAPSLRVERTHLRSGCTLVAGMDEVGRGALAGPVTVGVVLVCAETRSAPVGLRDSKLLTAAAREALVAPLRRWGVAWGFGHAEPDEIDAYGIMTGLRLAGRRALTMAGLTPDVVVLDGNHNWLTDPRRVGLFAELGEPAALDGPDRLAGFDERAGFAGRTGLAALDPGSAAFSDSGRRPPPPLEPVPPVVTVIKGDMTCSSVAAASVLAKVERDGLMIERHNRHPEYGWAVNKGYAAPAHREALMRLGPCVQHRRSWNLRLGGPGAALDVTTPSGLHMGDDGARLVLEAPRAVAAEVGGGAVEKTAPLCDEESA